MLRVRLQLPLAKAIPVCVPFHKSQNMPSVLDQAQLYHIRHVEALLKLSRSEWLLFLSYRPGWLSSLK
jgi:hypothetical protein